MIVIKFYQINKKYHLTYEHEVNIDPNRLILYMTMRQPSFRMAAFSWSTKKSDLKGKHNSLFSITVIRYF
jgi:hypothetical protein